MTDTLWRGEVPVSARHDDPYFSLDDGLAETRAVYLDGCGLPERYRAGFVLAELGTGACLTLAAAFHAWRRSGVAGPLRYQGFEAAPLPAAAIARALSPFPDIAAEATDIVAAWDAALAEANEAMHLGMPGLEAVISLGDARRTVPLWQGCADAWFLDGFAPSRNPDLWEAALLAAVADRTAPGGRLATYTAAGHVRRALKMAGLQVERVPGWGRKRHMTRAAKVPGDGLPRGAETTVPDAPPPESPQG